MVAVRYAHKKWQSFFGFASKAFALLFGLVAVFFASAPGGWGNGSGGGARVAHADVPTGGGNFNNSNNSNNSGGGGSGIGANGSGRGSSTRGSFGGSGGSKGGGGAGGGGGSGSCFAYGTEFRMANGSLKCIQDIQIGDGMLSGGKVRAIMIGDGLVETWVLYRGIKVTASHPVYDADGVWRRVGESPLAVSAPQEGRFWTLINEHNVMIAADGTAFTDYLEIPLSSAAQHEFWSRSLSQLNADAAATPSLVDSRGVEA